MRESWAIWRKSFAIRTVSGAFCWPRRRPCGRLTEESAPVTLKSSTVHRIGFAGVIMRAVRGCGSRRPAVSAGRAAVSERRAAAGDTGDRCSPRIRGGRPPGIALALPATRGEVSHVRDGQDATPIEQCDQGPRSPSRRRRRACHAIPPTQAVGSDSEAPEDAIREEEGPESWEEWKSEAPDAGRGEDLSIEREFTHGRSRS